MDINDFKAVGDFCVHQIEVVVVGPEQPLVDGIHDYFEETKKLSHIANWA